MRIAYIWVRIKLRRDWVWTLILLDKCLLRFKQPRRIIRLFIGIKVVCTVKVKDKEYLKTWCLRTLKETVFKIVTTTGKTNKEMAKYSLNNMPRHLNKINNNINLAVTLVLSNNSFNSFRRNEKLLKNRRFSNNNREVYCRQDRVIFLANKKAKSHHHYFKARSLILPQKVTVLWNRQP